MNSCELKTDLCVNKDMCDRCCHNEALESRVMFKSQYRAPGPVIEGSGRVRKKRYGVRPYVSIKTIRGSPAIEIGIKGTF